MMKTKGDKSRIEYSIYTISKSLGSNDNRPRWEKKHVTCNYRRAVARAKILYKSNDYSRVEIKKKVCDDRNVCDVVEGFRIFDRSTKSYKDYGLIFMVCLLGVVALGGAVFLMF